MTTGRRLAALAVLAALAGCGPAFVDVSEPERVAICYNKATIDPQDLLAMASVECAKYGGRAQLRDQTLFYCPAFSPVMMEFSCVGGRAQPETTPTPADYVNATPTGTPNLVDPETGPRLYSREFYVPEQGYSNRQ
jgi:hypothetical protein